MHNEKRSVAWSVALVTLLGPALLSQPARAQTFTVLHNFTGGVDGALPSGGVVFDAAGNLYGTTAEGGYTGGACADYGCGAVFKLKAGADGWTINPLYNFHFNDGNLPIARVVFGPDGTLYGTTFNGGTSGEYGTVFNLRPPPTVCKTRFCPWTETVLWNFTDRPDGANPGRGDLTFDAAGHLYGTTVIGGSYGGGTVFELAQLPGGGWRENIDFSFGEQISDGFSPWAGVIFDNAGKLYTTTFDGGYYEGGTVVELVHSAPKWTENVLHLFQYGDDGEWPYGGLIFDQAGNLYGTTTGYAGNVFEMKYSGGAWNLGVLYRFVNGQYGPVTSLTMDRPGNLYGTTETDGLYGNGNVFKLTLSNGAWTYSSLHDFTGGSDGGVPVSEVTIDPCGNLYGSASSGGAYGKGVVWKITP